MYAKVKKDADNHDIEKLRYIFIDCLDVDPTFDRYKEDYLYCNKMEGFFEAHNELTPILDDEKKWNMEYWIQLKLDLEKNFSKRRFEHMVQVAKVVYADKIKRLLAERESRKEVQFETAKTGGTENVSEKIQKPRRVDKVMITDVQSHPQIVQNQKNMQEQDLQAKRRAIELENQRIEEQQRKQRERIVAAQKAEAGKKKAKPANQESKKVLGITLAILAVIVVIVLVVL